MMGGCSGSSCSLVVSRGFSEGWQAGRDLEEGCPGRGKHLYKGPEEAPGVGVWGGSCKEARHDEKGVRLGRGTEKRDDKGGLTVKAPAVMCVPCCMKRGTLEEYQRGQGTEPMCTL